MTDSVIAPRSPPDPSVDSAVAFINAQVIETSVELARRVGRYVIDTFFDGDYANFTHSSARKSQSFRALCEREDLLIPHTRLYTLVRVSHQLSQLPATLSEALPLSHHRALLSVKDIALKQELARMAVRQRWTKRQLEAKVQVARGPTNRGRKPLPRLAKVIPKLATVAASMPTDLSDAVAELPASDRRELADELRSMVAELQHLLAALEKEPAVRLRVCP